MKIMFLVFLLIVFIIYWVFLINSSLLKSKAIESYKLEINNELSRRQRVYSDMIKVIVGYNEYEKSTFKIVLKSRGQANTVNSLGLTQEINTFFESYPNIKSNDNYKRFMAEISLTENRIENKVKTYNNEVKSYEEFISLFPNNVLLSVIKKNKYNTYRY